MLTHPPATIPAEWSPPTSTAVNDKYADTAQIPDQHIAHKNPQHIADFLRTRKELSYVFIASDSESHAETIAGAPSPQAITKMFQRKPQTEETDITACSETWDAITLLLEELDLLDDFRYILVWRLSDEDFPELNFSHHYTRKTAWKRVRFQIHEEHRHDIPTSPPFSAQKAKYKVTLAAPTLRMQQPMLPTKSSWPLLENHSPFREPAWRWNRAWSLLHHDINPSAKTDDESTLMAYDFLQSVWDRPHCRRLLRIRMPSMYFANKLRTGDPQQLFELESRLLTD